VSISLAEEEIIKEMAKDKLYIVTGSSKGIGAALVKQLLKDPGNSVIGIARSQKSLSDPRFTALSLDLSDYKGILDHLEQIFPVGDFQEIVLVNNAGWIGEIQHLGKMAPEGIYRIFMLNTIAPTVLINAFIKTYGNQKGVNRMIVNISSGAAKKAIDGWSCYSASKAAVNMLSEAAAAEAKLDGTGIRIFAVAPGVVDTAMQQDIRSADAVSFSSLSRFVELKEKQQLSSPSFAAGKIIELIQNAEKFDEVLLDVREF
jgi:benzil reductase ((S)-benzoin forming)